MTFSLCFISLITICILPNTYSNHCPRVPDPVSCSYFGAVEDYCGTSDVPVSDLPENCSSFVYYDVNPKPDLSVDFGTTTMKNDEYMTNLLSSGKCVFLYYGRPDPCEWMNKLSSNSQNGGVDANTEMLNLKAFIEPYSSIAGLIIEGFSLKPDTPNDPNLTNNFKIYLEEMKNTFPDYGIGFEIFGTSLITLLSNSSSPSYLDFSVLDCYFDFYVVNTMGGNHCTEKYKIGGTLPVNGSDKFTVDKMNCYVQQLGIPKNKTYWAFRPGPMTMATNIENVLVCDVISEKVCAAPTLDGFCAASTQNLYDKGAFVRENGAGIIALDPDLKDDPNGCCGCENGPYPGFHSLLAGFNGDPIPPNCTLFDKPS